MSCLFIRHPFEKIPSPGKRWFPVSGNLCFRRLRGSYAYILMVSGGGKRLPLSALAYGWVRDIIPSILLSFS